MSLKKPETPVMTIIFSILATYWVSKNSYRNSLDFFITKKEADSKHLSQLPYKHFCFHFAHASDSAAMHPDPSAA